MSKSLDQIMQGFDADETESVSSLKSGRPITIWLPAEYKAAYEQIQSRSGRRFTKKLRELIQAAIDVTQERAS
jgi:hypothetical protein